MASFWARAGVFGQVISLGILVSSLGAAGSEAVSLHVPQQTKFAFSQVSHKIAIADSSIVNKQSIGRVRNIFSPPPIANKLFFSGSDYPGVNQRIFAVLNADFGLGSGGDKGTVDRNYLGGGSSFVDSKELKSSRIRGLPLDDHVSPLRPDYGFGVQPSSVRTLFGSLGRNFASFSLAKQSIQSLISEPSSNSSEQSENPVGEIVRRESRFQVIADYLQIGAVFGFPIWVVLYVWLCYASGYGCTWRFRKFWGVFTWFVPPLGFIFMLNPWSYF